MKRKTNVQTKKEITNMVKKRVKEIEIECEKFTNAK